MPRTTRLFTVERPPHTPIEAGRELVLLPPGVCPRCGDQLLDLTSWQPALLTDCGYGAARESRVRRCTGCGWGPRENHIEVNPRAFR
jgi:hypothetical protein